MSDAASLLPVFTAIAIEAGERILEVRSRPHAVIAKGDGSPLTEADYAAEQVIAAGLARAAPWLPVVSEEAVDRPSPGLAPFIMVDPLDGTKEFMGPTGEFTVNIALMEGGRPVAGVVHAPAIGRIWRGLVGHGAENAELPAGMPLEKAVWRPSRVRRRGEGGWVAVASRSHLDPETEAWLARLPVAERRSIGSSLKFCLLADGEADVYPRFGDTMEWDIAAGHAVLEAAGGRVTRPDGTALLYGRADKGWHSGPFIGWGAEPG